MKMNRIIIGALFVLMSVAAVHILSETDAFAQIPLERVASESDKMENKFSRFASISLSDAQDSAEDISEETRKNEKVMLHPWKDKLPFEINLDKLRAFIIAGRAVEKNNRNWDALLAGADNDEKAREFFLQESEESIEIINEIPNISADEYKVLYQLSLEDGDFAVLLRAIRQHVYPDDDLYK